MQFVAEEAELMRNFVKSNRPPAWWKRIYVQVLDALLKEELPLNPTVFVIHRWN